MPRYKHGKQTAPIDFQTFKRAMEKVTFEKRNRTSYMSFVAFLYWFGPRKSEALERVKEDFVIKDALLIVDCPAKKGGKREPLEIPVDYPYVALILKQVQKATAKQPIWTFSPRTAITIVKRVMGEKYYPHFFRLNRATRFLEDPTCTLPEMLAWFGWKASKTVDPYIGYSRRHIHRQRKRLGRELM